MKGNCQKFITDFCQYQLFAYHLNEYKKGLRDIVLFTTRMSNKSAIEERLRKEDIDYFIQEVNANKVNIFFGDRKCVDVIKEMRFNSLSDLSDEEDFMLGIMLGYDSLRQCERYLKRKHSLNWLWAGSVKADI